MPVPSLGLGLSEKEPSTGPTFTVKRVVGCQYESWPVSVVGQCDITDVVFGNLHQAVKTEAAKICVSDKAVPKYYKSRPLPYVVRDVVN